MAPIHIYAKFHQYIHSKCASSGFRTHFESIPFLKVTTPLQMLINIPTTRTLAAPDHSLATGVDHLVEVRSNLQSTFPRGDLLATRRKVVLNILALVLERSLARVLLRGDLIGPLDPLHGKTAIHVPDNMAVHEPGTWIVGLEANDGVAGRAAGALGAHKHCGVSAVWVVEVESRDERGVPGGGSLTQNAHVVAVKMHGV